MKSALRWPNLFAAGLIPALAMIGEDSSASNGFLARNGAPEAVIVIGRDSGPFHRWVAEEVQRYTQAMSGAELPIVFADELPPGKCLLVLGGPDSNPLAAAAEQRQLVQFAGLKPDGLIVRTVELDGRPAIVAGGNDESGTMYAAYELLEPL